ncbi:putative Hematopoietic prostaglandin D synthase [Hypsibius exemplaris]|uniref:glutathione transferase n=1 Tax=Hypsibius exemplaris TaxID=2072580 RepID=A0A1W0WNX8_HYPEX|nr:putative Hematopoietic prostaglandin D synthase [Hypsibius exemplaris]
MSSPQYKLVYFNARGLAEAARFIFAYSKVAYEDVRIEQEAWPALKSKTPFLQLPYLEINGKPYGQSAAFTRLLAKKYKLAGTTDEEQAQVDAIVDYMKDVVASMIKWFTEKDEAVKAKLLEEFRTVSLPSQLDVLQQHLGKADYFVPSGPTFADFSVASMLFTIVKYFPGTLDKHPQLKEHMDRVHALPGIKEWVAKRPESQN